MPHAVSRLHALINGLQTLLLMALLLGIAGVAGALLFGNQGMWLALAVALLALILEPVAASWLTLALYGARPIPPSAAPELWHMAQALATRAGLPAVPVLHYVASPMVNAFAVGNRRRSAVALTTGLLETLTPRELFGVLAHETAHIANGDLRVMGLADSVSRITALFALTGQLLLLVSLPAWVLAEVQVAWSALLLLTFSPHLAMLAQLGLSRVREYDADRKAAELTGDPEGLALALTKIERVSRGLRAWMLPGWGNPEPSWLRTHPATEARIARLMQMAQATQPTVWPVLDLAWLPPSGGRKAPRWHPSGLWR